MMEILAQGGTMSTLVGSVKKIGTRVTHIGDNIRVEGVFKITAQPTADQQKAYENNPGGFIKELLRQEGLPFKDVRIGSDRGLEIVSHLELQEIQWFHIEWDRDNPGMVCIWTPVVM
jgi:hypothetical protein